MSDFDSKTSNPFTRWRDKRDREKLKKPLRFVIHPTRIIAFVVLFVLVYYARDFLQNHFMMLSLWLLVVLFVANWITFVILYRGLDVELTAPERDVERLSIGYLRLKLKNASFMFSFNINVKLDAENAFYGDSSGSILSLACGARSDNEQQIPIKYSMNGIYRFAIKTMQVTDMLGMVSVVKKVDEVAEVNVFPERSLATDIDMSDMNRGMTESEETIKKGHDFSDVSDVREYIPGDKLMSIHWKLSAKRDILMVKDRVSMSDQQMVILTELSGSDEQVDEIVTLSYAVVKRLVEEQTYVRLMWWSESNFSFEERQIISKDDLKEAFSSMYYEQIYSDAEKTRGYMLSIHPELKAYVKVCIKDGEPNVLVVEQD